MTHGHRLRPLRNIALDLGAVALSMIIAFWLRFDLLLTKDELKFLSFALWAALLVKGPVFHSMGIDSGLRRFAAMSDLFRLAAANLFGSIVFTAVVLAWIGRGFPRSVYILDLMVCFLFTTLIYFSERLYREVSTRTTPTRRQKEVVIYGAGTAGVTLLREIRSDPNSGYRVVGFLDDDVHKVGAWAFGVRILGTGREVAAVQDFLHTRGRWIDEVILALPAATGKQMQEALANCRAANIPCKTVPSIGEILNGRVLRDQIRNVNLADLLGRQPVVVDESPIGRSITGRSILVTGAAGSIGSELCRQIARFRPGRLVAFDQAESELFKLECELRDKLPNLELVAALGDLRDPERVAEVIEGFSIQSIFHAAAYKHVPMMESHVMEASKNNILGTWNLLNIAQQNRVTDFLQISTDKAVNPTNVMGASKRVCELLVSSSPKRPSSMKCVAVRFGNVLGSNGSVVPIFQSQIAMGGPVRVTHPEVRRYFMTISEAVSLVLQASTMGKGSEIFVLDMGEPVQIVDLAKNLIRLAGYEPYKDIDIQFTGLRPGEKLFEETNLPTESTIPTHHEKIKMFRQVPPDEQAVEQWMAEFRRLVAWRKEQEIVAHIRRIVPEYQPEPMHLPREQQPAPQEIAYQIQPGLENAA